MESYIADNTHLFGTNEISAQEEAFIFVVLFTDITRVGVKSIKNFEIWNSIEYCVSIGLVVKLFTTWIWMQMSPFQKFYSIIITHHFLF